MILDSSVVRPVEWMVLQSACSNAMLKLYNAFHKDCFKCPPPTPMLKIVEIICHLY